MTDNSEEIIPLTSHVTNDIEKYFNLNNNIETIRRIGPFGDIKLHVTNYTKHNEIFQLLLTNDALQSLENISFTRRNQIRNLFLENSNLFNSSSEIEDSSDYIEWSLIGDDLIKKRQEFREQIDLYKTYDNQHNFITKLLIEIIDYYLNQYLIQQEHFSKDETNKLEFYFKRAIEEKNYFIYFIKAYTLTNK
jgi:hypothetical protein